MKILDRYISYTILGSILVVMSVLLALFTFFSFLEQIKDIGQGNYDALHAIYYVLLTLPTLANQLFPMAALMGVTIGLGILSSSSELIAIRSAGVSIRQIVYSVLKVGALIMVLALLIGELIAPRTEQYAQMVRSVAISKQLSLEGDQGLWARDGDSIINVQKVLGGGHLGDIYIYRFDDKLKLKKLQFAKSANYENNGWRLREVRSTVFTDDRIHSEYMNETGWQTGISPDLLSIVTVKSSTQSTYDLYHYINYLESNDVAADSYKQAFWSKLAVPFVTGVMVLLAIPFVFGPLRSVGIGHRILVGVLVGVGFHLINLTFSHMGLVFQLNAAFASFLPTVTALFIALIMLRRVR